jgi:aryl-alcohol dehydrogenase (NADP+)
MQYTKLGHTGPTVSRICLGCMSYGDPKSALPGEPPRWAWALPEGESRPFFTRAIEAGINFFDTARQSGVTAPIVGATKMEHLDAAVAALDVTLSKEEVAALEAGYAPHPVAGY